MAFRGEEICKNTGQVQKSEISWETTASTRRPLITLYGFAEPQFPYLLSGDNYGVCFTTLSLGLDEMMNAKSVLTRL